MFSSSSKLPHCILVLLLICGVIGSTVLVPPAVWAANGVHSPGNSDTAPNNTDGDESGGSGGSGDPTDGDPDELLKPSPELGTFAVWITWFMVWTEI